MSDVRGARENRHPSEAHCAQADQGFEFDVQVHFMIHCGLIAVIHDVIQFGFR
jgi:hypothetical protein